MSSNVKKFFILLLILSSFVSGIVFMKYLQEGKEKVYIDNILENKTYEEIIDDHILKSKYKKNWIYIGRDILENRWYVDITSITPYSGVAYLSPVSIPLPIKRGAKVWVKVVYSEKEKKRQFELEKEIIKSIEEKSGNKTNNQLTKKEFYFGNDTYLSNLLSHYLYKRSNNPLSYVINEFHFYLLINCDRRKLGTFLDVAYYGDGEISYDEPEDYVTLEPVIWGTLYEEIASFICIKTKTKLKKIKF